MIVYNFNFGRTGSALVPSEANTPLVVDPDAPLSLAVAFEFFQPMARKMRYVRQVCCGTESVERHFGFAPERLERLDPFAAGEAFGACVAVAQDHTAIIGGCTYYVKRNDGRQGVWAVPLRQIRPKPL